VLPFLDFFFQFHNFWSQIMNQLRFVKLSLKFQFI
jgi:hypothetical protein